MKNSLIFEMSMFVIIPLFFVLIRSFFKNTIKQNLGEMFLMVVIMCLMGAFAGFLYDAINNTAPIHIIWVARIGAILGVVLVLLYWALIDPIAEVIGHEDVTEHKHIP